MPNETTDRRIVIHEDDVGNSHGANEAMVELFARGAITSCSVMVPCPWFPEAAELIRAHPEYDVGVHLTLTAEFERMRWRPLTGVSDNGLVDAEGFMPRTVAEVAGADPAAVEAECRLQVETALAAGIDITHIDAHMGGAWAFLDIYLKLGAEYRVPVFLPRTASWGMLDTPAFRAAHEELDRAGNPRFAGVISTPFGNLSPTAETYREILDSCVPGLNYAAFHPTAAGDFGMNSPDAALRATEYGLFRDGTVAGLCSDLGLKAVGMRQFRDEMRAR
jgi:predicted glycoside hydrolase/deacetylase ChbG (UPF0249 family)